MDPGQTPFSSTDPPPRSTSSHYAQFHTYPFLTDASFLSGLSSILNSNEPSHTITEAELDANPGLVLNAKLFYFSRQNGLGEGVLDARGYVDWLRTQTQQLQPRERDLQIKGLANTNTNSHDNSVNDNYTQPVTVDETHIAAQPLAQPTATNTTTTQPSLPTQAPSSQQEEPPYPPSFAAIIDLITANKPIPGIEDIPNTVLEMGSSKIDHTPRRRKPWETDATDASAMNMASGVEHNDDVAATSLDSETRADPVNDLGTGSGTNASSGRGVEVNGRTDDTTQRPWQQTGTGQGVAQILQPAAIPPSGLLSND